VFPSIFPCRASRYADRQLSESRKFAPNARNGDRELPSLILKNIGRSLDRRFLTPRDPAAAISGNIALWVAIEGKWRSG